MEEAVDSLSPSLASSEVADDDKCMSSPYYFESEALATHGNGDYRALLTAVTLLEAQRSRATHDLQRLVEMQRTALADPIAFVDKLQRQRPSDIDVTPQRIAELPVIAWQKYASNVDLVTAARQQRMRKNKSAKESSLPPSASTSEESLEVRARVKLAGTNRPETFNQPWHSEEQRRLQQLLLEFPPEEVEAKRWAKIATALGNRTAQQVASRIQKYFIKLARAGLPVPGRMPHVGQYNKKGAHRHQRHNKFYFQPSTFLTSYEPPVYMSDDEDDSLSHASFSCDVSDGQQVASPDDVSDEEDIPVELRDTPMYHELMKLKRLCKEKLLARGRIVEHTGFKCDRCHCDPIVGTRWHCRDCRSDDSIDFCDECAECPCEVANHDSSHRLDAIREPDSSAASSGVDHDYMRFMPGGYNYLDSNFLPAT